MRFNPDCSVDVQIDKDTEWYRLAGINGVSIEPKEKTIENRSARTLLVRVEKDQPGTHADIRVRADMVRRYISSESPRYRMLAERTLFRQAGEPIRFRTLRWQTDRVNVAHRTGVATRERSAD